MVVVIQGAIGHSMVVYAEDLVEIEFAATVLTFFLTHVLRKILTFYLVFTLTIGAYAIAAIVLVIKFRHHLTHREWIHLPVQSS